MTASIYTLLRRIHLGGRKGRAAKRRLDCRPDEDLFARRETWGPGPWTYEPDRIEWFHNGVPCLMTRGPFGAWNGYVAVYPDHPLYGKTDVDEWLCAHGGITYAKAAEPGYRYHVASERWPERPVGVWWLGFDCGHAWDIQPGLRALRRWYMRVVRQDWPQIPERNSAVYRTAEYVRANVETMADEVCGAVTIAVPVAIPIGVN